MAGLRIGKLSVLKKTDKAADTRHEIKGSRDSSWKQLILKKQKQVTLRELYLLNNIFRVVFNLHNYFIDLIHLISLFLFK